MADANPKIWGFYPYTIWRKLWEYLIYFLSLFTIWECTYVWFLGVEFTTGLLIANLIIDFIYFLDIFVILKSGVLKNGIIVLDKSTLMASVPKWRRIILYISPIPFYLFGTIFNNVLLYDILICTKLIRILRLRDATVRIKTTLYYINNFSRILILFSYLFTLIHLFTCIFWFAGTKEPKDSSWITFFGLENQTIFGQYVHTYYFVTTTVLSIGYGDVHPTTFPEIITVIFIELIGVVFYNFLAANFFSLVADPSRNLFLTKYKRVIDGFDHRGVSKESENEIIRYYEYIWEKERIQTDYFQTAKQFPESLQKRISLIMYMNLFNRIGFENIPIKALEKMALAMKPKVFTPGDFIVKAGRVSNHIFFVEEGTVDIFNINGKFVVSFDESKGEIIGENSFLDGNEETANVIAHTYVEAFELSRVDLEDIPEIRETLRNVTNDNQNIQQNEDSP